MKNLKNTVYAVIASLVLALVLPQAAALGATVKVTVNEAPITDVQISQRAKLLELERRGNSASARLGLARQELIDEQLKLQEAKRLGMPATNEDVTQAYLNVARNMRVSSDNLDRILTQNGVNPQTLKERLRASIAWGNVSRTAVQERIQFSERELEQKAAQQLSAADNIDYILKEVLFIIPHDSNISTSRRTAQANQYRRSFQGCDSAVELSLSYTDAAVVDMGRRHATQLPDALADELAGLGVGGITKPRVVDNGVSMLAVCSKTAARDLTFVTGKVRQELGNELLKAEAETYLEELRTKASIENR